ncbi:MAG: DUF3817 domain-containing protein [Sphingobacteriales bacterium]|jgi:integral membrane protein|nr:MAG: DUF3817 domain-containing protein [Sphingobacteriales bacterium]
MTHWLKDNLSRLRLVGFAEGLSWLLLLGIAMPLKYIWQQPAAVKMVGWAHGVLFMLYLLLLLLVKIEKHWPLKKWFYGIAAAFLPFGTWIFDAQLKKENRA